MNKHTQPAEKRVQTATVRASRSRRRHRWALPAAGGARSVPVSSCARGAPRRACVEPPGMRDAMITEESVAPHARTIFFARRRQEHREEVQWDFEGLDVDVCGRRSGCRVQQLQRQACKRVNCESKTGVCRQAMMHVISGRQQGTTRCILYCMY